MRKIAVIEPKEREALFRNTSAKMGVSEAVIEKDFWVCYVLDYLFHRCRWKDHLAFKGGTSLSKAYDLIKRFSEDIDLILDERARELYAEGHRWMDLRRTKQLVRYNVQFSEYISDAAAMANNKGEIKWYRPIPANEISANTGISQEDQNPGY